MKHQEIKNLRKALGLRQPKMAEKIGISAEHLSRIENGHHKPGTLIIRRLAEIQRRNRRKLEEAK